MKKLILSAILLSVSSFGYSQTAYIDDTLLVPLRSGEGTGFRIVHKGLRSGTALEILEQNAASGYSHVKTPSGLEGYLPTRYLRNEPIAKAKLAQAEKDLSALKKENKTLSSQLSQLNKELSDTSAKHKKASSELNTNTQELSRIKSISADAINLDNRNKELRESNEQLRNELELVQVENIRLKDKSESSMMLMGGGLVFLGFILALVLPLLRPNKKSDGWS